MLADMDKWFVLAILLLLISWACPSRMQKLCVFPPPPISFIKIAGLIDERYFSVGGGGGAGESGLCFVAKGDEVSVSATLNKMQEFVRGKIYFSFAIPSVRKERGRR